jgi:hypothetical protein
LLLQEESTLSLHLPPLLVDEAILVVKALPLGRERVERLALLLRVGVVSSASVSTRGSSS